MHRLTRITVKNELLVINLFSLTLVLIIFFVDSEALRIVLGLPFILFFPGYTLIATLFPRNKDIGTIERIALSVAFSVIITPLIGLVLSVTWEIRLYPVLLSLAVFIAVMSAAAWYRRRRVPQEDRVHFVLNFSLRGGGHLGVLDRVVSVSVAIVFLGAILALAYAVASPKQGERYTEFYVLGAQSRPRELSAGTEAILTLGVVNREGERMSYSIDVIIGESLLKTVGLFELDNGQNWENEVRFTPNDVCAATVLAQDVAPNGGSSQAEVKIIEVDAVDHLQPGDQIWIGEETAVVEEIAGHSVILGQGLKQNHAAGTKVTEVQRVKFRLFKVRELAEERDSALSIWVGEDHLSWSVLNLGGSEASYQTKIKIRDVHGEEDTIESVPQVVAVGAEWAQEIDYAFSENYKIEFSLYKDGELAYQKLETESYPSLQIWIHVTGTGIGD